MIIKLNSLSEKKALYYHLGKIRKMKDRQMAYHLAKVTSNFDLWLIALTSLKESQVISSSDDKLHTWGKQNILMLQLYIL